MRKVKSKATAITIIFAILIIVVRIAVFFICNFNDTDYIVTVTKTERIVESNDGSVDSKYLIYCEDDNDVVVVFENTDSFIRGKFNSSDIYAQIKEGHRYKITVVGFRIRFLSAYQNIIKIQEL